MGSTPGNELGQELWNAEMTGIVHKVSQISGYQISGKQISGKVAGLACHGATTGDGAIPM